MAPNTFPIHPGTPDVEYETRIEAQRVTLELNSKSTRSIGSVDESPLFGGPAQQSLFGGYDSATLGQMLADIQEKAK